MEAQHRIGRHWIVLAITSAGTFLAFLDATIVSIAFPDIITAFPGSRLGDLSWILNGYTVAFAAALVPLGRLADLVGRRRTFISGLVLFTAASAACAAAWSPEALIAGRLVQGLGAAAMIPAALGLVLSVFPPERRATAVGAFGTSSAVAAAAGPALGGLIVEAAGWRWVFTVNVPLGIVAVFLAYRLLGESRDDSHRRMPDWLGTILLAAGVAVVAFGIVKASDWGWTSFQLGACAIAAALLIAAFALRSAAHPSPAIEPGLWRVPSFTAANTGVFLFAMGFFAMLIANPLFLTAAWHYSLLKAGLAVAPGAIAAGFAAPLGGWAADRWGQRVVIVPGVLIFALSRLWIAADLNASPDFVGFWLPGILLSGFGVGLAFPAFASAAVTALPPGRFATGSAIHQTSRQIGAILGVAILVAVLEAKGNAPAALLAGFRDGYVFAAGIAGLSVLSTIAVSKRSAPAVSAVQAEKDGREPAAGAVSAVNGDTAPARQAQSFVYRTPIFFDELDAMKMLHNARYPVHMERALTSFYESAGKGWRAEVSENPDQFHVVREAWIEYTRPFLGTGEMAVEVWVEKLGTTSCTYRLRFTDPEGSVEHARGRRLIIKVDPDTLRPTPWTDSFVRLHEPLLVQGATLPNGGAANDAHEEWSRGAGRAG